MTYFIVPFLLSFALTLWLVRYSHVHAHLSHDHDLGGAQKFHTTPVPRIGGVGIMAGLLGFTLLAAWRSHPQAREIAWLMACALPAFVAGLIEDVTKRVSPLVRLIFTALSALLAGLILDATINRLGIFGVDYLLSFTAIGLVFTAFAVAGVANAINIIDGFNGLASVVACTMLASLFYVAFSVGDALVMSCCLALIGAILGFFLWNYPSGGIFLGDGGAYLIGFLVADLAVYLVHFHPEVSPWYPALLFVYPVVETMFSIYRRRFLRGTSPSMPDGVHLHTLVYRRLIRWALGYQHVSPEKRNAMTSPYLWLLSAMAVLPATVFFRQSWVLFVGVLVFILSYVWLYFRLVRFRSPNWLAWLHLTKKRHGSKSRNE
jgi:UDP-GlcNAc:undecaprenyl-phosphate GlcNAc-1-phosphate transferase